MRLIDADLFEVYAYTTPPQYDAESYDAGVRRVLEEIDAVPTVLAEPVKHSEWVWDDNAIDWGLGAWVCRECHSRNENIHAHENENPYVWRGSQFCPNCGARMKGADNDA